jgi:hypothetical protein
MARARTAPSGRRSTRATSRTSPARRRASASRRSNQQLTNLETKLGEVIGLAMAAQGATDKIAKLTGDRELKRQLKTMRSEAIAAEKGAAEVAGTFSGKKGAIMKEARQVKRKATKMMSTYLDRSADGLDGFEFLTMAEAAEVGHWTVLSELNKQAGHAGVRQLTRAQLPIQKRHLKEAMDGSVKLASKEDARARG